MKTNSLRIGMIIRSRKYDKGKPMNIHLKKKKVKYLIEICINNEKKFFFLFCFKLTIPRLEILN